MKTFTNINVWTIAILAFVVTACQKDNLPEGRALPNAANFKALRAEALADLTQSKTFKAQDGLLFTSAEGTVLTIHPSCLTDQDGNAITGDVTLSFVELYDRGDMVTTNKPLMGRQNNGPLLPLVTGGEFNIEVKQGAKILKSSCSYTLKVPAANTGAADPEMIFWKGQVDEDGNLVWEDKKENQGDRNRVNVDQEMNTYNVWASGFGWTNVDRFYSFDGPKTAIKVTVPTGYDNSNASVYLAYKDQPGMLAYLDTYDTAQNYFSEHYGFVPVGMSLYVIFVSESNGSYIYAIKESTIVADATIAIQEADLQTTTAAALSSLIDGLD